MSTLDSLNRQSIRDRMEVIVVDDGSAPPIEECEVTGRGAELVRHPSNRGLGAARNTGVARSRAPVVAFTDDDCRPEKEWAGSLLDAYAAAEVAAAGGPVEGTCHPGLLARYYRWNQPIRPLEADLGRSPSLPYRLWLYARQNISPATHSGVRDVFSLVGANFSFRRDVLEAVGGFDGGISFGGEDEDVCDRIRRTFPDQKLRLVPTAVVEHEYDPRLRDAASQGQGVREGECPQLQEAGSRSADVLPDPCALGPRGAGQHGSPSSVPRGIRPASALRTSVDDDCSSVPIGRTVELCLHPGAPRRGQRRGLRQ